MGEESQEICKAFRNKGHEAFSCDLKGSSGGHPEWHLQQDMFQAFENFNPDLAIVHPVCTFMCNSGALRLYIGGKKINGIDGRRWSKMVEDGRRCK
jgi:hypothetical protein